MYYESELYHHGITGQKWGKKNGPPYPLSRKEARKQRREEKKSARIESAKRAVNEPASARQSSSYKKTMAKRTAATVIAGVGLTAAASFIGSKVGSIGSGKYHADSFKGTNYLDIISKSVL